MRRRYCIMIGHKEIECAVGLISLLQDIDQYNTHFNNVMITWIPKKGLKFLDELSDYYLCKKGFAPWNSFLKQLQKIILNKFLINFCYIKCYLLSGGCLLCFREDVETKGA